MADGNIRVTSLESFIEKSNLIHKNKYDYSKVNYVKSKLKVTITCKEHGEFEQAPFGHLLGRGCAKCGSKEHDEKRRYTTEQFIEKAKEVHGSTYDYSLVNYTNSRTKINIVCFVHGTFKQNPSVHILGRGCLKCSKEKDKWTHTKWRQAGEISKEFDSFKVYVIKCWNNDEQFFKIGKTYHTVKRRFSSQLSMPYNYSIVRIFEGAAKEISILENKLQKENKNNKYTPNIWFPGITECFNKNITWQIK